jgi:hypothetical protein
MCSCDLEQPDFWSEKLRKARKQHHCCECGSQINLGEVYHYCSGKWDDSINSFKTCLSCHKVRELLDCVGLGELHESLFYEHLVKDEDNDSLVVSLDDRIEVVSQYPNLKVRLKSV